MQNDDEALLSTSLACHGQLLKMLITLEHMVCFHKILLIWERSDSVVECLTRDRGAAGSSLASVTVLCP